MENKKINIIERNCVIGYMGIRHIQTGLIQNLEVARLWLKKDEDIPEGSPNPDPEEITAKCSRILLETSANYAQLERRFYKEEVKDSKEVKN